MNLYAVPPLLTSMLCIALLIYILYIGRAKEHRAFALLMFILVIWSIGEFMERLSESQGDALFWAKFLMTGLAFLPTVFIISINIFLGERVKIDVLSIALICISALISILVWSTEFIVEDEMLTPDEYVAGYGIIFGKLSPLLFTFMLLVITYGLMKLAKAYLKSQFSIEKAQIKLLLIGTSVAFILSVSTGIVPLLLGYNNLVPFGNYSVIFLALCIFYAIAKHKFLVIKPVSEDVRGRAEIEERLEKGGTYLILDEDTLLSYDMFIKLLSAGEHGLIITDKEPDELRKKHGLKETPIIYLTEERVKGSIKPTEIEALIKSVREFLSRTDRGVILLDGISYLIKENRKEKQRAVTLSALQSLAYTVKDRNARLIVPVKPSYASSKQKIIRTDDFLQLNILNLFLLEKVCNDAVKDLEQHLPKVKIKEKIESLKSKGKAFEKIEFIGGAVTFNIESFFFDDIGKIVRTFVSAFLSSDVRHKIPKSFFEKYGLNKYEVELEKGSSYLIEGEDPSKAFEIYKSFISSGVKGLCFSRTHPKRLAEKFGLGQENVFWISKTHTEKNVLLPTNTVKMVTMISEHLDEHEESVILIDGIEYLISQNGYEHVLKLIQSLNEKIAIHDSRMLIPLNPNALDEIELKMLERELEVYAV